MLSLYRRHRPRTFEQVVGQEHIVRTLRNAIDQDKVHHAYLFVGSRGTGKTSMAKLLACALNAEGGPRTDFSPDDPACAAIANGTSLDVVEMDAASNNSVDDIRELRQNVAMAAVGGGKRIYILDEAHMLSSAAWNAFLKTLEEPPPHVVFVLATTEAHKVPATIVDRCHRFDFHRPSLDQIAGVLRRVADEEGIELPDAAAGMIARSATGSFRDALGTLEQLVTYGGKQVELDNVLEILGVADVELVLDAAEALAEHDPKAALEAVARLASTGRDYTQFTRDLSSHLRHVFVVQTLGEVPDSFSVTSEHTDRLAAQAGRLSQGEIIRAIELLATALGRVKDGSEPRIELEVALLKAVEPAADASLQALMFRIEQLERRVSGDAPAGSGAGAEPAASGKAPSGGDGTGGGSPPKAAAPASAPKPAATAATAVGSAAPAAVAAAAPEPEPEIAAAPEPPTELDLERITLIWPATLDAVRERNAMVAALLGDAKPATLEGRRLTVSFPASADFSRKKAEANRELVAEAMRGLTGVEVSLVFEANGDEPAQGLAALSEEELLDRLREEFGAEEVFEDPPEGS